MTSRFLLFFLFLLFCSDRSQRIARARDHIDHFNFREAEGELLPFQNKDDAEARFLLGVCALAKRDLIKSRNHFQVAVKSDSTYRDSVTEVYLRSIKKHILVKDYDRAEKLFADLVRIVPNPNLGDEIRYLGEIYYRERNYMYAIPILEGVLESETTKTKIWKVKRMLIECYNEEKFYNRALTLIEELIEDGLNGSLVIARGMAYYRIAEMFKNAGEFDSAEYYARATIENLMPKSLIDDSYFILAEISEDRGDTARAISFYKKVIRLNPYLKGPLVARARARIESLSQKGE
ncbi:MAG TPA: tetratricopeptide repeat protein [bacterium (Candidatus Stahlbacteria)]|nr:tetratricopeptide repeat protein [Candidatus Stahlbacteria bacterium]